MAAKPELVKLSLPWLYLRNDGDAALGTGFLKYKMTLRDGTVSDGVAQNSTVLAPGETTRILFNGSIDARSAQVVSYAEMQQGGRTYPMNALMKRGFFGWSLG